MPTFPLATLSASITSAGISSPTYADVLQSLQVSFQQIYGSDAYITPDSQDGQLLAVFAQAIYDCNMTAVNTFNSFSPTYAQGAGLSSLVKINGLTRLSSSFSTAVGNVIGVAGTTINNGSVKDENSNIWNLPSPTIIPPGGSITVTVTAANPGNLVAPSGTINVINTPTYGWQSFISTADAAPGAPVETDSMLRTRQSVSTEISAETPLDATYAALANLPGVERLAVYENDTNITDLNGIPPHTICVVIQGGDVSQIATVIGEKKTPGCGTYGTTTAIYVDSITGISYNIHFYILSTIDIKVVISGTALPGFSSAIVSEIQNSVAAYINNLKIGDDVQFTRLFAPAYLNGGINASTYEITAMTIQIDGMGSPGTSDLILPFNKTATCAAGADVTISII